MANNQLLASDNFASGSLAAGWSAPAGFQTAVITAGTPHFAEPPSTSAAGIQFWTGLTWGSDQICEVTVETFTSETGTTLALHARNNLGGNTANGYQVLIQAGTYNIYRADSGVVTSLASGSITIVAGDVLTFAVIGSCLLLYQNGTRIAYTGDATYTSGFPGFAVSTTTNVTHVQVASWRGYSIQQADGVWTKQACVLPASAAELLNATIGTGNTGFLGMSFGPARFLSGNVYRGYFANGLGTNYAESIDGKVWQRYSGNPIISGKYGVDVFFYNGTYYLLTQVTPGNSVPHLQTSTDGLTFTDQGACSGLSAGFYYGMHFADVIGGTFYALFSGLNSGANNQPSTYLATSPDAKTWTVQNSGSPVIVGTFCGCQISKIGGSYYFWATQNQPGQGNAAGSEFDPYEAVRYQSTNLTSWTASKSVHNSLISDSLNINTGGVAACAVIDVNGLAFMYYQGGPNDAAGNQIYQTMLATAPTSVENLINFPETATSQVAADPFTRGAGGLGPNWTTPTGASPLQIASSGIVEPSALNTTCIGLYSGAAFSQNQYSEVTIKTLSGTTFDQYIILIVLGQTGVLSFYGVQLTTATGTISSTSAFSIFKKVNGSNTLLNPVGSASTPNNITLSVGDVIRLAATAGSDGSIILTVYQNGFQVLQAQDYAATFTSGLPGVFQFATDAINESQISAWAGGNLGVIPPYPPPNPIIPATVIGFAPNWYEGQNNAGLRFYVAPGSINGVVYPASLPKLNVTINKQTGLLNAPVTVYFWLNSAGQIQQGLSLPASGPGANVYPIAAVNAINVLTGTRPNGFSPQITQAPGIGAVIDLRPITQTNFSF